MSQAAVGGAATVGAPGALGALAIVGALGALVAVSGPSSIKSRGEAIQPEKLSSKRLVLFEGSWEGGVAYENPVPDREQNDAPSL
jgi:hypothetical protein